MSKKILYGNDSNEEEEKEYKEYKTGTRMNKKEKIEILKKIFDWEVSEKASQEKKPVIFIRNYLRDKYDINVPYSTLYRLTKTWCCEYDENKDIKCIYALKK